MKSTTFRTTKIISTVALCAAYQTAGATDLDWGVGDLTASWTSNVTAGAGIRTKNPSCALTGDPNASNQCGASANTAQYSNGDDGDLNYRKGQFYTSYLSFTSELLLTMPSEGYKFMIRGTGMYDFLAGDTARTDLSTAATDQTVRSLPLLDLWVEKDFQIAGNNAHIRLGNQVINWGESDYAMGGINATNSLDIQKLLIPGTQLKQGLLPAPMVSFAANLPDQFSTEGYYQFQWNGNRYPAVGTFFSTSDIFGRGSGPASINTNNLNLGGLDPAAIAGGSAGNQQYLNGVTQGLLNGNYAGPPTNSFGIPSSTVLPNKWRPQFGLKFGYAPKNIDASFGFYYENYTDKSPVLSTLANGTEQFSYLKNRELFGVSANFPVRDWAVGAELSYRPHDAVALTGCFAPGGPLDNNTNAVSGIDCLQSIDEKKFQFDINGVLLLNPTDYPVLKLIAADAATLTAEATWIYYPGIRSGETISRNVGGQPVIQGLDSQYSTWLTNSTALGYPILEGVGTPSSGGITIDFNWTYDGSLIPGWQVTPGVTITYGLFGHTPTLTGNYQQGVKSINAYILFNQNPATWQAGINFTTYFGGNDVSNSFADRNLVGVFATRNF